MKEDPCGPDELYNHVFLNNCIVSVYSERISVEPHDRDGTANLSRVDLEVLLREMNRARDGYYPCPRCNPLNSLSECKICKGTGQYV